MAARLIMDYTLIQPRKKAIREYFEYSRDGLVWLVLSGVYMGSASLQTPD